MTIHVSWDNRNKSIVRWEFDADWDWTDFEHAWTDTSALMAEVSEAVDILIDLADSPEVPSTRPPEGLLESSLLPYSEAERMIVLTGYSEAAQNLVLNWLKDKPALRQNFAFIDYLDEARQILYEADDEPLQTEQDIYELDWYKQDEIILLRLLGDFDLDHMKAFNEDVNAMLVSASGNAISLIIDTTETSKIMARPVPMRNTLTFLQNPRLRWLVVVGANDVVKFLTSVVLQLTHIVPIYKNNLEETIDFLKVLRAQ